MPRQGRRRTRRGYEEISENLAEMAFLAHFGVARDGLLLSCGRVHVDVVTATRAQQHASRGRQSPHQVTAFPTVISLIA